MKFSISDTLTTVIGTAILAGLGYLLYADIMSRSGPGNTELIGKITSKRNVAERKYTAQVVWDEIFRNSKLYNYDTVRTADRSEAVIQLNDGTQITLNENSMILLALSQKEVDIKFIQGTISARQSADKSGTAKKINIESGESKISLKGGDVSLSQNKENQLQMTVNRGTATLSSGKEQKVITENQNIIAGKDEIRLYDLSIKLIAPENNRYIESTTEKTPVNFSWERPRGDYTSYLEIANNPAGVDPFIKRKSAGGTSTAAVSEGDYYWRVSAINNKTKKIEMSEIRKITVINDRPIVLITPAHNSMIKYRGENPLINFLWTKNNSADRYTLVVSTTPDMAATAVKTVVNGNRISLSSLGQGTYYWKIAAINETDRITKQAESAVYSFKVTKTEKIEPPVPIAPAQNRSIHPRAVVKRGLTFTWSKSQSIADTQISVAEDDNFSKILFSNKSRDTFYRLSGPLKEGTYYWRLKGILTDGSTTDDSSVRRFKVAQEGSIKLIEPRDKTVIMGTSATRTPDIDFVWSKTDLDGSFRLQISKNRNFSAIVKEQSVEGPSTTLAGLPDGLIYWRVKMVDEQGAEILSSPISTFSIVKMLDAPIPIVPGNGTTVDMIKKDTLDFSWKPVKGANLYRIGLYQITAGIQKSIATLETRNTMYQFTELQKLDVGRFLWTLQAFDTDPATAQVQKKSDEVRMTFNITLGIKGDFKFKPPNVINAE